MTTASSPPSTNPYRRALLRQGRSVNTRRAIILAAARLWGQRDYAETTVEDLCAAAGVGRSTYYLHFESKERLLIELALATARGVAADVEAAVQGGTVDDELRAFMDGLVRRMEGTPRNLAVAVMRQVAISSVSSRKPAEEDILFDDVLTRVVQDGQERGELRSEVDARDVGEVMAGMTLDALQRWAGGTDERTLRQRLELRFDLAVAPLRAPRPVSPL
ncbi:MAG TPA: TetR/AcrR family transcriptional regulator [Acidimicrobiales bacterium]|jgi:AcrR family transcriptional regulator|nr:TetR/AcrR family transcriptional regulator [Acidimicrobiales bacterium]